MFTTLSAWDRAVKFIPNGCQTLSKGPDRYVNGVYPKLIVSGHGCEVYDEEGIRYVDYISGLGSNFLGYNNPAVDDAVKETIMHGQVLLSLPHPKEGELAEKLAAMIGKEQFKFFKTGSESTSAAVRVARAYTKRETILMCGYNGWHDWAAMTYDRPAGVPKGPTIKCEYNKLTSWEQHLKLGTVAAVILEPVIFDEPKNDFLENLIELAHQNGALVIFDEVVTGLRFGSNGVSGLLGVSADLICMGKALGNGYSIAVLAGSRDIMSVFERDDFIASGTFSGELIGISAALAVIENLDTGKIWQSGTILKSGFNKLCLDLKLEGVSCIGYPPRNKFEFPTPAHKALFWQECIKRNVLFGYSNFVTLSHGAYVLQQTLSVCEEALRIVKNDWSNPQSKLEGSMPRQVL